MAGDLNAFEDEGALTTLEDGTTTWTTCGTSRPSRSATRSTSSGRLQTLDHMLVTDGLQARVADFRYAHFDNDYYERRRPARTATTSPTTTRRS